MSDKIIKDLMRSQIGSSAKDVDDDNLEEYIIELLKKEAKEKQSKYAIFGTSVYTDPRTGPSNKTNKRFLSNVIKATDGHNRALAKEQFISSQKLLKDINRKRSNHSIVESKETEPSIKKTKNNNEKKSLNQSMSPSTQDARSSIHSKSPSSNNQETINTKNHTKSLSSTNNQSKHDDSRMKRSLFGVAFKEITEFKEDQKKRKMSDEMLIRVIEEQFEIEKMFKLQEISIIKAELFKGNKFYSNLKNLIESGSIDYQFKHAKLKKKPARGAVYAKLDNDTFVRLVCPDCNRSEFGNRGGFVSHCKSAHNRNWIGKEEWNTKCGIPVDAAQVPLNDLSRVSREKRMRIYDEEDSDQDSELFQAVPSIEKQQITMHSSSKLNKRTSVRAKNTDVPLKDHKQLAKEKDQILSVSSTKLGIPSVQMQLKPALFFAKKRLIIGNISSYLQPSMRDNLKSTHLWKLYIRSLPNDPNPIASYIKRVRVFLHPSYAPNDIIDLLQPPFELTRSGWGEFPIRIQFHFKDSKLNRPVDVYYPLCLNKKANSANFVAPEKVFDIELDKNTTFEYVEADKENNIVKSAHPSTSRDSSAPIMMSSMSAHPVPSRSSNTKVDHLIVPNTIPECLLTETNEIIDRLRIAQEYEIQDIPDIKFQSHLIDKLFPKKSYHTLSAINSLFCKYCGTNDHPLDELGKLNLNKCQFRPMTRKGRIRFRFRTSSLFSSLCENNAICPADPSSGLKNGSSYLKDIVDLISLLPADARINRNRIMVFSSLFQDWVRSSFASPIALDGFSRFLSLLLRYKSEPILRTNFLGPNGATPVIHDVVTPTVEEPLAGGGEEFIAIELEYIRTLLVQLNLENLSNSLLNQPPLYTFLSYGNSQLTHNEEFNVTKVPFQWHIPTLILLVLKRFVKQLIMESVAVYDQERLVEMEDASTLEKFEEQKKLEEKLKVLEQISPNSQKEKPKSEEKVKHESERIQEKEKLNIGSEKEKPKMKETRPYVTTTFPFYQPGVKRHKLMTPYHVFRAIYAGRFSRFDFLTNAYVTVEEKKLKEDPMEIDTR